MKIKYAFILFILFVVALPILFPGNSINVGNLIAFGIVILISLVVGGTVIVIMQSKSNVTLKENIEHARDVVDGAFDGDIDQEFIMNKHFIETGLSREDFWDMMEDEYDEYGDN